MLRSSFFKRRQLLYLGGTGVVGVLGGTVVTKTLDAHANPSVQSDKASLQQNDAQPYLDDAMWTKYRLDTMFGQNNKASANGNPLYSQQISDVSQDSSLQALQQRGAHVALCHDALVGLAGNLEAQRGLVSDNTVYNELAAHLVPHAQLTPSGSSLIAVAQHLGFTYAKQ